MIIINNLNFPLQTDFSDIKQQVSKELKISANEIVSAKLYRKSIDARHKNDIRFCCSVLTEVKCEEKALKNCKKASVFKEKRYIWKQCGKKTKNRPVIVGFGPAGMFAGLCLSYAGLKPIILERGADVDTRTNDINEFFSGGKFKENSNIQFGEGGAGTFSDGKLNTGIKDERVREIIKTFVKFGANEDILTDAKPHIGTDILKKVVKNIRLEIIKNGGEIRFNTKLEKINLSGNKVVSIETENEELPCDNLVLAVGHSARDTFEMLKNLQISMEKKPFAIGVRVEHLQKDINKALYGEFADSEYLGAADYKLATHLKSGRGVYTFCMCPGGEVVNASSETGGIAVNGMSENARDKENANSALLVGIEPSDFLGDDVLSGCELQRKIEENAYKTGEGRVPVNTVGNFVFGKKRTLGKVKPSVKPNYILTDFSDIFPEFVIDSLKEGIVEFNKKIEGFADFDAVLTAPETRSSSPIRILRKENGQSENIVGIYPCGEGAGYAGGITSAAVDGLKTAEKLIENL